MRSCVHATHEKCSWTHDQTNRRPKCCTADCYFIPVVGNLSRWRAGLHEANWGGGELLFDGCKEGKRRRYLAKCEDGGKCQLEEMLLCSCLTPFEVRSAMSTTCLQKCQGDGASDVVPGAALYFPAGRWLPPLIDFDDLRSETHRFKISVTGVPESALRKVARNGR